MSDVGVNAIRKIERRGAARKGENVALRREGVDLVRIEIDFQRVHEHSRILDVVLPFHELSQPQEVLVVRLCRAAPFLVLPVCGDALLGDQVHLSGADLHFERLALLRHDRRVQRLVEVRLGHGDVVLDPAGHRPPHLMDDAQSGVTVFDVAGDDAEADVVVDLADVDLLAAELRPDRVHRLDPAVHVAGDLIVAELRLQCAFDPLDQIAGHRQLFVDRILQVFELARMHVPERQVLELVLEAAHAQAVGDRRVDLHRLLGDGHLALVGEVLQRAHVVQPVGELDQHHAQVADHRQQHLAEGLRLLLLFGYVSIPGDFGDAVDQLRDVLAEHLLQLLLCGQGVFENVVQQADGNRRLIEVQICENVGNVERVDQIGFPRTAHLPAVLSCGKDIGLL